MEAATHVDRKRLALFAAFALVMSTLMVVANAPVAAAAVITVDTTADELNADGDCSLREAIQSANLDSAVDGCAAGSGADTIEVPAGTYQIGFAGNLEDGNVTGDFDITNSVVIRGAGARDTIIDAADLDRAFHVKCANPGVGVGCADELDVTIDGMTIQNGQVPSAYQNNDPNWNSAGSNVMVWYADSFTLANATVRDGDTDQFDPVTAWPWTSRGAVTIRRAAESHILNSSIINNRARDHGGLSADVPNITVINSTISGNEAAFGGGLGSINGGTWDISYSTIANNTASWDSGAVNFQGGVNATFHGVLITGNPSPGRTCATNAISFAGDYNVYPSDTSSLGTGDCADLMSGANDIETSAVQVQPLADNGGPTDANALLAGSVAIDHIPAGTLGCGTDVTTDQRGFEPRPFGSGCDVGAYEDGATVADVTDPTVTLTTPPEGAVYDQNAVVAADYTCADEAGGSGLLSCVGDVPDGDPIDTATLGAHTFTVAGTDNATNTTTATHNYTVADVTDPTVTLTTPPEGAVYDRNEVVAADYACADEAGGSGLLSCVGDVPDGDPIDTATLGAHTFTVVGTDNATNSTTVTHNYTIVDVTDPTVTLTTPPEGAVYDRNEVVAADYACADEAGGSGLLSCVGDVPDGDPIDTATLGAHTFTVVGTDNATNSTTVTHNYTVVQVAFCAGLRATIVGTDGAEILVGTPGDDVVVADGGADTISTGAGNDTVCAGDGDDTIFLGPGDDTVFGEAGIDTVDYRTSPGPVDVNLAAGTATGNGTDTLSGIENLFGSPFDDVLRGDAQRNIIAGAQGNDSLQGREGNDDLFGNAGDDLLNGREGDDLLDGGAGLDRATYIQAPGPVTVDLRIAGPQATGDGTDTIVGIVHLNGSNYADMLIGNAQANELRGGGGNDTLEGRSGNDTLRGNQDIDTALGGAGTDSCTAETTIACE